MPNILQQGKTTLEFIWEMNKIKQMQDCRKKIADGKLPPESYNNLLEAIRLMESGAMKKDQLLQAATDRWRKMTRKEQHQLKKEHKEWVKEQTNEKNQQK